MKAEQTLQRFIGLFGQTAASKRSTWHFVKPQPLSNANAQNLVN